MWYVECLKNCCDAVDRTYYDAILLGYDKLYQKEESKSISYPPLRCHEACTARAPLLLTRLCQQPLLLNDPEVPGKKEDRPGQIDAV